MLWPKPCRKADSNLIELDHVGLLIYHVFGIWEAIPAEELVDVLQLEALGLGEEEIDDGHPLEATDLRQSRCLRRKGTSFHASTGVLTVAFSTAKMMYVLQPMLSMAIGVTCTIR